MDNDLVKIFKPGFGSEGPTVVSAQAVTETNKYPYRTPHSNPTPSIRDCFVGGPFRANERYGRYGICYRERHYLMFGIGPNKGAHCHSRGECDALCGFALFIRPYDDWDFETRGLFIEAARLPSRWWEHLRDPARFMFS